MTEPQSQFIVRLPKDLHANFKSVSTMEGESMAQIVLKMVHAYVGEKIDQLPEGDAKSHRVLPVKPDLPSAKDLNLPRRDAPGYREALKRIMYDFRHQKDLGDTAIAKWLEGNNFKKPARDSQWIDQNVKDYLRRYHPGEEGDHGSGNSDI